MNTDKKHLIKNLSKGKDLEENIPKYVAFMAENYFEQSLVHCSMKYYTLYEQVLDRTEMLSEEKEELDSVNVLIKEVYAADLDKTACLNKLDAVRTRIMDKMDVLTSYTDQLMVYEYMLNRLEHKFEESNLRVDDTVFAQQLIQYIFGVKDNFVVNERVKEVIGQLPVRMARSRFYELVKNSMTLYKGSDKSSLESYLYMMRTSTLLYQAQGKDSCFSEIGKIVKVFEAADYDAMEAQEYKEKAALLKDIAVKIKEISDFLVSIQEIVNNLYVYTLTKDGCKKEAGEEAKACLALIHEIEVLFEDGADKEIPESVMEYLYQLEGCQERLAVESEKMEAVLELAGQSYSEQLSKLELTEMYENLQKANKLMSTSVFVKLDEEVQETADEAFVAAETEKILEEFTQLFQNKSIRLVRAVIANAIDKMPVFFNSTDEVMEYIKNSLSMCKDTAEKQASIEILKEIMETA